MKSYAIYDADLNRATAIGYMFYYEKAEEFVIELWLAGKKRRLLMF